MRRTLVIGVALILVGCRSDSPDDGTGPGATGASFAKYVAMGTSVSMGFASDGVVASSQQSSWPALLAADLGASFTLPLIDAPGCRPPIASPLGSLRRTDNTLSISTSLVCAPNVSGVTLPAQNVAIAGQTATDAFTLSPVAGTPSARVLTGVQTQTSAMKAQNPTFVSVEFGANEVLPALNGLVSVNTTVTSIEEFQASYGNIIDAVKSTGAKALLVTIPSDVSKFPAVRTSPEIASQRTAFSLLHVSVNSDCNTSPNLVTIKKLLFVLNAASSRLASGLGPADLSCADVPGTADAILSPAEVATLNNLVAQINSFITAKANENGYALMSLGVLYDNAKNGTSFDLATAFTSSTPFGNGISLDGIHPSASGHAVLAAAAKAAIIAKYGSITK